MKRYTGLGLAGLLTAVVLFVASCGGAGGGTGNMDEGHTNKAEGSAEKAHGTDHPEMGHGSGDLASGMVDGKYSDRRFIDAMLPHHEGAVEMARVALKNAEHDEIRQLAEDIVSTQKAEIKELESIKQEEFGTSKVPKGMSMQEMKGMGMMSDPQSLAKEDPFDKAFIDQMTPHHQSAIEMAEVAAKETANPDIKELATNIVEAQKHEISQMEQWRKRWYPQG